MAHFEKPFSKRSFRILSLAVLGLILTSCSESKVSQCNKLIEIANRAVSGVKAVSENPTPGSLESMKKIADVANTAKAQMEALQLSDDQLKTYQTRFITMYQDTNQATRNLVAASEKQDSPAATKAFDELQTATSQEGPLVNEVNSYCNASPATATETVSPSPSPSPQ